MRALACFSLSLSGEMAGVRVALHKSGARCYGQHPAERPKNSRHLWCRDKQCRHLRLRQQIPDLPTDTSGVTRHQPAQPGEACRQTGTPWAQRPKAGQSRDKGSSAGSRRRAPGLDPSYQRLKAPGHPVQIGPQQQHDRARRQLPPSMGGDHVAQRLHRARKKPRKLPCRRKFRWGESFGHERKKNTSANPLQEKP